MTVRRATAALTLATCVLAPVAAPALAARPHRLQIPPRPAFPRSLSIDESEYALNPSRTVVSSGRVRLNAYNRGMDDHDVAVYDAGGAAVVAPQALLPGTTAEVTVTLPAGTYRVVCSLFAGTPLSHEALGMRFTLTVQDPPASRTGALRARSR